ncbi:MAG: hypothetical protein RLY14_2277 [Planctomycetota bacterium]|jgi:hypothetical protein
MDQAVLENGVISFLEMHSSKVGPSARRLDVRDSHVPSRDVMKDAGDLQIQHPSVRDRSQDEECRVFFLRYYTLFVSFEGSG